MASEPSHSSDWPDPENDFSREELQCLARQLEELDMDFRDIGASIKPLLEQRLRELAGPHLESMLSSQEETLKYLSAANPDLRQAALRLAYRHWNITDMLATVYEEMALTDPDDEVRETAMGALGTCCRGTKDPRIGHLLAATVRNEGLAVGTRVTAYASLIRLHGHLDYTGKSPAVPLSLIDIDWPLVEQYYRGWLSTDDPRTHKPS